MGAHPAPVIKKSTAAIQILTAKKRIRDPTIDKGMTIISVLFLPMLSVSREKTKAQIPPKNGAALIKKMI